LLTHTKVLWTAAKEATSVACSVEASCSGTELRVTEGTIVTRRERYADRSTAYERARTLREDYGKAGFAIYPTV